MGQNPAPSLARSRRVLSALAWVLALIAVACALFLGWSKLRPDAQATALFAAYAQSAATPTPDPARTSSAGSSGQVKLPALVRISALDAIPRLLNFHTVIPNRPGVEVRTYTVDAGDSVFDIANQFNIAPETVLWANYDLLDDNPDMISVGMELNIPPQDGVYYTWKEGDTVDSIASQFKASVEDMLNWSGNNFDLTNPTLEAGAHVFVPGGEREFRQWVIPTIPRGKAGVSPNVYGGGTCSGGYDGAMGTGGFVWPAGNTSLSGNDYWSGHLGVDIAAGEGAPIYAADSGVVVFAGSALGGYGNMIMIDHGNGYQTLYAHLSSVAVGCGQSVGQGSTIGYSGSTGNSTGAHLHFEVRFMGGFISPWFVLP